MNYDGRTRVGGPAQTHDLGSFSVTKAAVGPMDNNAYVLIADDGTTLLIDAAAEAEHLLELLPGRHVDYIVTTHHHRDHWNALADVVAATGARTIAGVDEANSIDVATDIGVQHGDSMQFGSVRLTFIGLRGHTEDSIAVHLQDSDGGHHIFTGDSLFPGGVGKTTPATFGQLLTDVTDRVFDVYDDAWIYPGHGWDTTLATERPQLDEWRARGW